MRNVRATCFGVLLLILPVPGLSLAEIRIVVDTEAMTLTVFEGDQVRENFEKIAIGRFGKTYFKQRGDGKTPLGQFTITWIKPHTRFHRFLGIGYPDLDSASRALVDGRISEADWQAVRVASQAGKTPPQTTPLGGYIGIHGVGAGDLDIHRQYNWTEGCIALTNRQVDRLARWARIGTPVEIR